MPPGASPDAPFNSSIPTAIQQTIGKRPSLTLYRGGFMTSVQDETGRGSALPSLYGFRVLAIVGVFLAHVIPLQLFADPAVSQAYRFAAPLGTASVSLFFALSGFVLTWTARTGETVRAFWRRRAVRLLPNHYLILLFALMTYLAAGDSIRWGPAVVNALLLQSWDGRSDHNVLMALNGPTWALSVDIFLYATFPLLLPLVRRMSVMMLWTTIAASALFLASLPTLLTTFVEPGPSQDVFAPDPWNYSWALFYFPGVRVFEFLAGMCAARLTLKGAHLRLPPAVPMLMMATAFLLTLHLPYLYTHTAFWTLPACLWLMALAHRDVLGRSTTLGRRTITQFAGPSYAFYLVHWLILTNLHALLSGHFAGMALMYEGPQLSTPAGVLFIAASFGLCWFFAQVIYRHFEVPLVRRYSQARSDQVQEAVKETQDH